LRFDRAAGILSLVGQEIVYCSKCQKRILGSDYAKGSAFELENTSCCAACAVVILDTLPPKAKEQLLAKMFRATQERHSEAKEPPGAYGGGRPVSSGKKIPVPSEERGSKAVLRPPDRSRSLVPLGIAILTLAVALIAVLLSSGGSSPPPPVPGPPSRPVLRKSSSPEPEPSPEEKRRDGAAKASLRRARDFAAAHPKDFEGQAKEWRLALLEAERTGYEAEAKRELDKSEQLAKEALANELEALRREVRVAAGRRDFKSALGLVGPARPRHESPEWAAALGDLEREINTSAQKAFQELKEKAVLARNNKDQAGVLQAKAELARWGLPKYEEELAAALVAAWTPVFDGKSTEFLASNSLSHWKLEGGALVQAAGQAEPDSGQTKEKFGDGEFRFRVSLRGEVDNFWFAILEGTLQASFYRTAVLAMGEGEHEVIILCRSGQATATLDGKPTPVRVLRAVPPRGRIHWNSRGGLVRFLSLDVRPLP
jgi:hypothetical protein